MFFLLQALLCASGICGRPSVYGSTVVICRGDTPAGVCLRTGPKTLLQVLLRAGLKTLLHVFLRTGLKTLRHVFLLYERLVLFDIPVLLRAAPAKVFVCISDQNGTSAIFTFCILLTRADFESGAAVWTGSFFYFHFPTFHSPEAPEDQYVQR